MESGEGARLEFSLLTVTGALSEEKSVRSMFYRVWKRRLCDYRPKNGFLSHRCQIEVARMMLTSVLRSMSRPGLA